MNRRWRHSISSFGRALSLACGLFVWAGVLSAAPCALAEEAVRLLLLAPPEAELTARIRGQTQDLGVLLEVDEPAFALSKQSATRAGREHSAQVVVWAKAEGASQLTLYILAVDTGELRSRDVSTPARETLASSTTAEMGALVVRSELSSMLADLQARREELERARVAAALTHAPPPNPTPAAPTPRVALQSAPSAPWLLGLAYRLARPIKGQPSHGFALTARRDIGGFALGLAGVTSLPFELSDAGTRISVQRLQLRIEALKHWQPLPALRLLLGLSGQVSLDLRSTKTASQDLEPAQDGASFSGGFGLLAEAQWQFSRVVGGFLAGGADAVPWRTKFVVEGDTGDARFATLAWLDPWLTVGLFTRF